MKVFEVLTQHCNEDGEVVTTRQYVASEEDSLQSVVEFFTERCDELDHELKAVQELLTVVETVPKMTV